MKVNEFFKEIGVRVKEIVADKKRLVYEIIYAAWPLLFIALFAWLPLFTARTSPLTFFIITDFSFLMGFTITITWSIAFVLYLLSRVTCLKPYSLFFRIFMIMIETFMIVAAIESCILYAVILPINVNLSFSLWLLVSHVGIMVFLTALEPLIAKEVEKAVANMPEPKKAEPASKPEEPKAEEPVVAATPEEPKPAEEAPKPKASKKAPAKEEPAPEEPKPE